MRATAGSGGVVLRTRDERNLEKVIQPSHALKILAPSLSYRLEWAKEWFYCAMPRRTRLTRPWSKKTREARKALAKRKLSIDVVGPARLVCRRHADRPLTRRLWNPPSERLEGSGDDDPHG